MGGCEALDLVLDVKLDVKHRDSSGSMGLCPWAEALGGCEPVLAVELDLAKGTREGFAEKGLLQMMVMS